MRFIFIDFEASSLWVESYPIEVGWCDETGKGDSYLIQREPDWTDEGWDWNSEQIHGISRQELLDYGHRAQYVGEQIAALLEQDDTWAVSDNPGFDLNWLETLLDAADLPMPRNDMLSIEEAYGYACQPLLRKYGEPEVNIIALRTVAKAQVEVQEAIRTRHRALPDAKRLAATYQRVQNLVAEQLTN